MRAPKGRKWTAGELSMLRQLAFRAPLSTIATTLDRSVLSIRTKAAHERLPLQDDLAGPRSAPLVAAPAPRRPTRDDGDGPLQPEPGDYVVVYQARTAAGSPRLTIVCMSHRTEPTLIRATFSPAEEAGPRFEAQAQQMAAAVGTRAFRAVDGQYTLLDAAVTEADA